MMNYIYVLLLFAPLALLQAQKDQELVVGEEKVYRFKLRKQKPEALEVAEPKAPEPEVPAEQPKQDLQNKVFERARLVSGEFALLHILPLRGETTSPRPQKAYYLVFDFEVDSSAMLQNVRIYERNSPKVEEFFRYYIQHSRWSAAKDAEGKACHYKSEKHVLHISETDYQSWRRSMQNNEH